MQCYSCGVNIPAHQRLCPACGAPRTKRVYIPLWGILGGLIGSFIGYNVGEVPGALVGGLIGIAALELAAWAVLRASANGTSRP